MGRSKAGWWVLLEVSEGKQRCQPYVGTGRGTEAPRDCTAPEPWSPIRSPRPQHIASSKKSKLYSLSLLRSPGLRARRSETLQQPLLVLQVLAHFLAHVEDGTVAAVKGGGQGPFPGLWPLPAAHPGEGAVCLAGTGKPITAVPREVASRISAVTWHGNPPRPPVPWGKPGPTPGEAVRAPSQADPALSSVRSGSGVLVADGGGRTWCR